MRYRCLDFPATCDTFSVDDDAEPQYCPYCGSMGVIETGYLLEDWQDGTCPECGSDNISLDTENDSWDWLAHCSVCATQRGEKIPADFQ